MLTTPATMVRGRCHANRACPITPKTTPAVTNTVAKPATKSAVPASLRPRPAVPAPISDTLIPVA